MRLAEGNKRLTASGAIGTVLGAVVGVGHIWGLDSLWWWDNAIETIAVLDGLLGALGLWGKWANRRRMGDLVPFDVPNIKSAMRRGEEVANGDG